MTGYKVFLTTALYAPNELLISCPEGIFKYIPMAGIEKLEMEIANLKFEIRALKAENALLRMKVENDNKG